MSIRILLIIIANLWVIASFTQSILTADVSLNYINVKSSVVFNDITRQTGAIFSYSDFEDDSKISIQVNKVPLKNVIPMLETQLSVDIIVDEKYLILKRISANKDVHIKGTILNQHSEEPISNASVFDIKNKLLVNTDPEGKFWLKFPNNVTKMKINVAKENYMDTSIVLVASQSQHIKILLRSFPRQTIAEFDSISNIKIQIGSQNAQPNKLPSLKNLTYNEKLWTNKRKNYIDLININDTLFNKFSVSLLPPIATNKLLSFHTQNISSLNIIGGNSKGLNGVELGGVYNYADGNVIGLQIAGVLNAVSESVSGAQISGVFNAVKGNVNGVQIAGVVNLNDKLTNGVQMSGVYQKTHSINGLQIAGVYNHSAYVKGGQISGLINVSDSSTTALQVAGLYNIASNIKGVQVSGLINICDTLEGLQIGIFNRSSHIKKGLALGLINLVKDGYRKLEFSTNELNTYQIGFRSGWAPLHINWFGGFNTVNKDLQFIQAGLGLASSMPLGKKISFEADANIRNTFDINGINDTKFNMYNQVIIGISWQAFKKLGFRTGLSINHFWYDSSSTINNHLSSLVKSDLFSVSRGVDKHKLWFGWQIGITFL